MSRLAIAVLLVAQYVMSGRFYGSNDGHYLYEMHCAACHGAVLQGSQKAPPLIGVSARAVDFMLRTGRMPAPNTSLQQPDRPTEFDGAQIRAITAYVVRKGKGKPSLPFVFPGDPRRGRELFAENCAHCHGAGAQGASVGYADIAPSLMRTAPEQIAEAVRIGPGVMPSFGRDTLSRTDVDDIAGYIRALQTQGTNVGGFSLGDEGPVAEGFIGWLFGLGALVLFIRLIGTTE
jgi:ubiquinol-cytochrome c reductase cytochrome c subunit